MHFGEYFVRSSLIFEILRKAKRVTMRTSGKLRVITFVCRNITYCEVESQALRMFFCFFRRDVYSILQAEGILLPRYAILNRDPNNPKGQRTQLRGLPFDTLTLVTPCNQQKEFQDS